MNILSPHGYATITSQDDGRVLKEQDTFTCCHCNGIVFIPPNPADREFFGCSRCDAPVCSKCHGIGTCTPFERKLEAFESAMRRRGARDRLLAACGLT